MRKSKSDKLFWFRPVTNVPHSWPLGALWYWYLIIYASLLRKLHCYGNWYWFICQLIIVHLPNGQLYEVYYEHYTERLIIRKSLCPSISMVLFLGVQMHDWLVHASLPIIVWPLVSIILRSSIKTTERERVCDVYFLLGYHSGH